MVGRHLRHLGDAHAGGEVAGAEEHGDVGRYRGANRVEQLQAFLDRQVRGLARRAGDDHRTHAAAGEMFCVAGRGGVVDVAVLVEEGDECDGDTGEHRLGRAVRHAEPLVLVKPRRARWPVRPGRRGEHDLVLGLRTTTTPGRWFGRCLRARRAIGPRTVRARPRSARTPSPGDHGRAATRHGCEPTAVIGCWEGAITTFSVRRRVRAGSCARSRTRSSRAGRPSTATGSASST